MYLFDSELLAWLCFDYPMNDCFLYMIMIIIIIIMTMIVINVIFQLDKRTQQ